MDFIYLCIISVTQLCGGLAYCPHDTVTVRVFISTGGRSLYKTLFSNCNNMSRNRYISDVLDNKVTSISNDMVWQMRGAHYVDLGGGYCPEACSTTIFFVLLVSDR